MAREHEVQMTLRMPKRVADEMRIAAQIHGYTLNGFCNYLFSVYRVAMQLSHDEKMFLVYLVRWAPFNLKSTPNVRELAVSARFTEEFVRKCVRNMSRIELMNSEPASDVSEGYNFDVIVNQRRFFLNRGGRIAAALAVQWLDYVTHAFKGSLVIEND